MASSFIAGNALSSRARDASAPKTWRRWSERSSRRARTATATAWYMTPPAAAAACHQSAPWPAYRFGP